MRSHVIRLFAVSMLCACGGDEGFTCDDPSYGDGTCDVEGACGAPDIDCFTTFASQADAQTWFGELEELVAQAQRREPRPLVSPSDPRFAPMQALLDEGWEAYKATHEVGSLAEHAPRLVIVDTDQLGLAAFVSADHREDFEISALAVMVETAMLDLGPTDDELLAVVMHEIEHAVGLHVIVGGRDRFLRAYVAAPGEPLGFEQDQDPVAREHLDDWQALATEAGYLSDAVLVGLPGTNGTVFTTMQRAIAAQAAANPNCATPIASVNNIYQQVATNTDELTGAVALSDPDGVITQTLIQLRDQCFAGFGADFLEVHATVHGVSEASIIANLTAEELALIDDQPFVEGMFAYVNSRRRHMREIEASFEATTGAPWSQLRYFSVEEAADDSSVSVLTEIGREPRALGDFFVKLSYSPAGQTRCTDLIDAGDVAPYGENLLDDHHGSCWRAYHVDALVDAGTFAREAPTPPSTIRTGRFRALPIAPRVFMN